MEWHIGCSGFHYKHWRGSFYPEKLAIKNWFSYYGEHFNTLELNVTFYRFPQVPVLENWYKQSSAGFKFAVKAPRLITHYKKFKDSQSQVADFYRAVQLGLKEKCGCCLFQLPPKYQYTEERLERIIKSLDPGFVNVLEFREESWWREEVYEALGDHHISFCGMSHPQLPDTVVKSNPFLYYRFHGQDQLYASRYSEEQLKTFAQSLMADQKIEQAYVFFNNDINTNAIYNAKELQAYLDIDISKK